MPCILTIHEDIARRLKHHAPVADARKDLVKVKCRQLRVEMSSPTNRKLSRELILESRIKRVQS